MAQNGKKTLWMLIDQVKMEESTTSDVTMTFRDAGAVDRGATTSLVRDTLSAMALHLTMNEAKHTAAECLEMMMVTT